MVAADQKAWERDQAILRFFDAGASVKECASLLRVQPGRASVIIKRGLARRRKDSRPPVMQWLDDGWEVLLRCLAQYERGAYGGFSDGGK